MGMPIHAAKPRYTTVTSAVSASTATMMRSKRLRRLGSDQMFASRTSCGLYTRPITMRMLCAGK